MGFPLVMLSCGYPAVDPVEILERLAQRGWLPIAMLAARSTLLRGVRHRVLFVKLEKAIEGGKCGTGDEGELFYVRVHPENNIMDIVDAAVAPKE